MYEHFFEMENTPFVRNIPADRLYTTPPIEDAMGRLRYTVDNQRFSVVLADPGVGKSTLTRMFVASLPRDKYLPLYLSDSKLTPRWLYAGLLDQMGVEAKINRGDSKRILQREIENVRTTQGRKAVCILDEAHLLDKETLEEFRFLLNCNFDSESPMALILVGQKELWEQKLRLKAYTAIRQRIYMNIVLEKLELSEVHGYIRAHLNYAGTMQELFTSDAEEEIYKISGGVAREINAVCEKSLLYAYQQQKRLIDGHMVRFVADHEMLPADEAVVV
jgi:type II secretory pathway predicted ATPase ExeA